RRPAGRRRLGRGAARPARRDPAGGVVVRGQLGAPGRRTGLRAAVLHYRLAGYDTAAADARREVELAGDGAGGWRVAADRPAPGAPPQLWDQGAVTAVRGAHALVLGVGQAPQTLSGIAAEADRAVPAVSAAWPRPWAGRLVVLVPGTLDAMAALLGQPADAYRGMGAVTTGRVGAGPAPADRVVINPEGYAGLSEAGRGIVLTHEVTHVATRARDLGHDPAVLSEGFADWAAYRATDRTPAEAAPELARAVRRGELPGALPADGDFAFGGDPRRSRGRTRGRGSPAGSSRRSGATRRWCGCTRRRAAPPCPWPWTKAWGRTGGNSPGSGERPCGSSSGRGVGYVGWRCTRR
ncbi:hypothetical protein ACFSNO_16810, partial [Streptomyces cirratus]